MKRIMVFTASRAEFGLYKQILHKIDQSKEVDLVLVVAGDHLNPRKGMTLQEITDEGFCPVTLANCFPESDTPYELSIYVGRILKKVAEVIKNYKPQLLLLLGDRHELLGVTAAAVLARVPIAHIAGGESTEGSIDEQVRHAVTKMAHVHFVSTFEYGRRIRLMGEEAWRIYVVGSPGIENIYRLEFLSREEILNQFDIDILKPTLLITYHPETLTSASEPTEEIQALISALKEFKDFQQVITYPGTEVGFQKIVSAWEAYAAEFPNVRLHKSLGSRAYLGVMKHAAAVVGNSSSGIIEAPSLKVPTINIGDRQKGRIRAESVIDVPCSREAIIKALRQAIYDQHFRQQVQKVKNPYDPYGDGNVSGRVVSVLESLALDRRLLEKKLDFPGPEEVAAYV